jgi:hypothetical protein
MSAVVDDHRAVRRGDRAQRVEVGREPERVLCKHRARARCHRRGDRARVGGVGGFVDVDVDRCRAGVEHRIRHRHAGEGRNDHLVAPPDAQRAQDRVHRHPAAAEQRDMVGRDADERAHGAAQRVAIAHPSRTSASLSASRV